MLVFVSDWLPLETVVKLPEKLVPPRLYLPDGRVVPTCVIQVTKRDIDLVSDSELAYPSSFFGGGIPLFMEGQNTIRRGMATCMVSDGSYVYALTARHVVGDPGSDIFAFSGGERQVVGKSHTKGALRFPLSQLYPGFSGTRGLVTLDAGLVRLDNPHAWTCQVAGVGVMGTSIDISADTMSLDLIGCPVFSAHQRERRLEGEIQGLFFQYASMFGTDFVAELLIGPREGAKSVNTRPGDSGSLWLWDAAADKKADEEIRASVKNGTHRFQPIGVQWGGQGFLTSSSDSVEFALASTLSGVCRQLDVEVVRDWNIGHSLYWGKVGHYKVAVSACDLVTAPGLAKFLDVNRDRVAVSDDDMAAGQLPGAQDKKAFIALADVPDLVWRNTRGKDKANHFADMDQPGDGPFKGKTLLKLWDDPSKREPSVWTDFYDNFPEKVADQHRGALPFRVRDMYAAMVQFVDNKELDNFLCAAGTLAHFVGDACQPLHVSQLHHGHPGTDESGVHAAYETAMLDEFAPDVGAGVNAALKGKKPFAAFTGADEAANAVVKLMKRTIAAFPPEKVVESYVRNRGRQQGRLMWNELHKATILLADGARTLATIWQSAWIEGGGEKAGKFKKAVLQTAIDKMHLRTIYMDDGFVESDWLKNMSD